MRATISLLASLVLAGAPAIAQVTADVPTGLPAAILDLSTDAGVAAVGGQWKTATAPLIEVDHRAPGPDLRASGAPIRTLDLEPHAGPAEFDDSGWEAIAPGALEARRGKGRVSFVWYRIGVTVPDKVGGMDPTGTTLVFELWSPTTTPKCGSTASCRWCWGRPVARWSGASTPPIGWS